MPRTRKMVKAAAGQRLSRDELPSAGITSAPATHIRETAKEMLRSKLEEVNS